MNILNLLNNKQYKKLIIKEYNKDDVLFKENEKCTKIGILLEGKLSIQSYLEDGNIVIYNIINQDEMFGNNLIYSSNPYYKGLIISLTNCKVAFIDKQELTNLLKINNDFLMEYLSINSNFSKKLNDRIKLLSISSAKERLMYYFHINNNEIDYESITSLANELYLQRETLSRLINKLVKEKVIIKDKNRLKLLVR